MEDNIIIVIDPGHGGENEGALFNEYVEKDMTMIVANAMKEELDKYEGISCYLTRTEDKDISLKKRVDFAVEKSADFFFCLHFNMSENHSLYGAECWISAFDSCYARANDFSKIEMELLTQTGLFNRGIKTRINSNNTDYYGVIRHSTAAGIPSVIIEHCHLDNQNDYCFYDKNNLLIQYGKLDATAVAKYYGLRSTVLNVDYSNEVSEKTVIPLEPVFPDTTAPIYCRIADYNLDVYTGTVSITLNSFDTETRIMYYQYSLDGGKSFSEYYPWPYEQDEVSFELTIPENRDCTLMFSTDNLYNLSAYSDIIEIPAFTYKKNEISEEPQNENNEDFSQIQIAEISVQVNNQKSDDYLILFELGIIISLLCITACITFNITRRSKNKKHRRKDSMHEYYKSN